MLSKPDQAGTVFAWALPQHNEAISKKPVSTNLNLLQFTTIPLNKVRVNPKAQGL
jgi:hypothetical protein